MESALNMGIVCTKCTDARLKRWQSENKDTKIEKGDFLKVAFSDGKTNEWMFVKVNKVIDKDTFEGELDNDPILKVGVVCGATVKVSRSQVAQLLKGN